MGLTERDWADALAAVDPGACNLSGLALSLAQVMPRVWEDVRAEGTDGVNRHPIVVLYLEQMSLLSGSGREFPSAYRRAQAMAARKGVSTCTP